MPKPPANYVRREDAKYGFTSYFDPASGFYCRTGVRGADGLDSGEDPFMAEFPELLDVGVMGHCVHGLSGRCAVTGVQCYQSGATIDQPNMTLADFRSIVEQARGRVFQFALGGRGDPDLHEDFEAMLELSRANGVVPNLTTSGFRLDRVRAQLIKRYCGAAAVSWYKTEYTGRAIDLLLAAGVTTNIHFLLSQNTLEAAIRLLETGDVPDGINRVIFLLFKPVGQGLPDNVLRHDDPRVAYFFGLMDSAAGLALAGFDSCCAPAVLKHTRKIDRNAFDTCEAARFSAYVTPDLQLVPCSFDQGLRWAVDIRRTSIEAAWQSPPLEDFRARLRSACPGCSQRALCLGGCPIKPEIVLCSDRHLAVDDRRVGS